LSGGYVVNLSSNAAAVTLPSTVTVAANGTTASFTAAVASVTAAQAATLTATGSGTTESFSINLVPSSASGGPRKVQLSWNPPSSSGSVAIAGYNVYRSANGGGYQMLNASLDAETSYTDGSVQSGVYAYYVESVDSTGASSAPSNSTTVTVP
jgi:fibronectin type 3 domain-containing protein